MTQASLFSGFGLDSRLLKAVVESGYTEPTPIQSQAIPALLEGADLIGTAQTGTGKTAAFALPILHRLLAAPKPGNRQTRVLIVTPTRELAEQIKDTFRKLGKHISVRCATVYGGVGFEPQEKALRDGTEVIVCCPGRLLDHMQQGHANLKAVEIVVLDEADRMLDMGFLPDIRRILQVLPKERQTMLFSATFDPDLNKIIHDELRHPRRVAVDIEAPAETVDHKFFPVPSHLKSSLLLELFKARQPHSVLVFTRTKHRANKLSEKLAAAGFATGVLHSNKSQAQRLRALEGFRAGKLRVLVATDIAARGLDIAAISHVVNFDMPDSATTYIHRIGRTGRAKMEGDAITFLTSEDRSEARDIERALGKPVEKEVLEGFDYHQASTADSHDGGSRSEHRGSGRNQHGSRSQGGSYHSGSTSSRPYGRSSGSSSHESHNRPASSHHASSSSHPHAAAGHAPSSHPHSDHASSSSTGHHAHAAGENFHSQRAHAAGGHTPSGPSSPSHGHSRPHGNTSAGHSGGHSGYSTQNKRRTS